MKAENKRLLDAFEYLDAKYIDELFDVLDAPPKRCSQQGKKSSFRYYAALAACLVLLAVAFPVLTNIISNIDFFPGWAESSEVTETPESTNGMYDEYILTEEDLAQINEAYFKFNFLTDVDYDSKSEDYWNEIRNSIYGKFASTVEKAMMRATEFHFYFGKYSECFVFSVQGEIDMRRDYDIAGYKFDSIPAVWVIHDSTMYYFSQAYDNGYLTDSDVGRIYDMYIEYFRDGVYPEETTVYEETTEVIHETVINPDYLKFVSDLEPISEELMLEIREAWAEYQYKKTYEYYCLAYVYYNHYDEEKAKIEATKKANTAKKNAQYNWFTLYLPMDGNLPTVWSFRYYGIIEDYVVLIKYNADMGAYGNSEIGDSQFEFPYGGQMYLYKDGEFLLLRSVFDEGLISNEQVAIIADRHRKYEVGYNEWLQNEIKKLKNNEDNHVTE